MKIKIAEVYSEILKETKIEPVAERMGKLFFGHLFFEQVLDEKVQKVLEEVEIHDNSTNIEIAKALFPLNKKYGLLAKDGQTFSTNAHWAWMNGLAEKLDDEDYFVKDSEVVA